MLSCLTAYQRSPGRILSDTKLVKDFDFKERDFLVLMVSKVRLTDISRDHGCFNYSQGKSISAKPILNAAVQSSRSATTSEQAFARQDAIIRPSRPPPVHEEFEMQSRDNEPPPYSA
jgi:hypothetical protein